MIETTPTPVTATPTGDELTLGELRELAELTRSLPEDTPVRARIRGTLRGAQHGSRIVRLAAVPAPRSLG